MLCTMFYNGLRPALKDIADFDELRVALRIIEQDHTPILTVPHPSKMASASKDSDFKELKGIVTQLDADVKSPKNNPQQRPQQ